MNPTPCNTGEHNRCYPMGNPEHLMCWCHCHDDWD